MDANNTASLPYAQIRMCVKDIHINLYYANFNYTQTFSVTGLHIIVHTECGGSQPSLYSQPGDA